MKKKSLIVIIIVILIVFLVPTMKKNENENSIENIAQNVNVSENIVGNETNSETIILNDNEVKVVQEKNSLENKTIGIIGDSLMQGYLNEERGFEYYLAQYLPNCQFVKNSVSGSTITENTGTDNIVMINQARTLAGNPDLIIFDGGANDIMGYALGTLKQELKKNIGVVDMNSADVSAQDSVISDLEKVVLELKTRFPNAKLCYLQPFLIDDDTISHLTTDANQISEIQARRNEFYEQVQNLCKKWDITYIDVTDKFVGTGTTYRQDDWIHIKEEGYQLLTPTILEQLKKIFD